jgi:hypothetical protein
MERRFHAPEIVVELANKIPATVRRGSRMFRYKKIWCGITLLAGAALLASPVQAASDE